MGLFSLFKRADPPSPSNAPNPATTFAPLGDDAAATLLAANGETARQHQQARQREIARATTLKIDAIESAMAFDIFNEPEPAWGSQRQHAPAMGEDRLGDAELSTTALPSDDDLPAAVAAHTAPAVDEIAILYANGQGAAAGQMLIDSIGMASAGLHASANRDRTLWWMLFDLYQLDGQRERFDDLSIDYASTFESSPPQWNPPAAATPDWSGVTPTVDLSGVLDDRIAAKLGQLLRLADEHPLLRLELGRVTAISAPACWLLLDTLRTLQARRRGLILAGAAELAAQLRASIAIGRRSDTEAPWLLLLELLQLLDHEKAFEEAAMDYCVTFEVSPPSFVTPPAMPVVATAAVQPQTASASPDRFMLPPIMEARLGPLLPAIRHYAAQTPVLVFDCSRLQRIDYPAAIGLHACLQPLAAEGRKIAFRDVNHLVAALLRLLGYADIARLHPHKY